MAGGPDGPRRTPKDAAIASDPLLAYREAVVGEVRGVVIPKVAIPALARLAQLFSNTHRGVIALDAGRSGIEGDYRGISTSRRVLLESWGQTELIALAKRNAQERGTDGEFPPVRISQSVPDVVLPVTFAGQEIPEEARIALADVEKRYFSALDAGRVGIPPSDGVSAESWYALLDMASQKELISGARSQVAEADARYKATTPSPRPQHVTPRLVDVLARRGGAQGR